MNDEILTRQQAANQGLRNYFTGKPCVKGHISRRNTITAACMKCVASYQKDFRMRSNTRSLMLSQGFEKTEVVMHPLDKKLIKAFIEFVNASRLDPRRHADIALVERYIASLELAWSFSG